MTTKDEALKRALDALGRVAGDDLQRWKKVADPGSIAWHVLRAIATCRAALAQKDEQQKPKCKSDPRAPHGFLRDASHCEDRYVCECEYWEPEDEQEPVAWGDVKIRPDGKRYCRAIATTDQSNLGYAPLYTAPPKRQPLTDEEIIRIMQDEINVNYNCWADHIAFCRAVEQAHGIGVKHDAP